MKKHLRIQLPEEEIASFCRRWKIEELSASYADEGVAYGIFKALEHILGLYSILAVAWVGGLAERLRWRA